MDQEGEEKLFPSIMSLFIGSPVNAGSGGLEFLLELARMADTYGMEEIQVAVELEILKHLTIDTAGLLLSGALSGGLDRVERESRDLALSEFDSFSKTRGFLLLEEEQLVSLIEDDDLQAAKEVSLSLSLSLSLSPSLAFSLTLPHPTNISLSLTYSLPLSLSLTLRVRPPLPPLSVPLAPPLSPLPPLLLPYFYPSSPSLLLRTSIFKLLTLPLALFR